MNGYAITSGYQTGSDSKHIYPLDNYGTLTIKDSGSNGSITGRGIYVQTGSKLTVESGSIYGIDSNGGSAFFQYGGDIIINGGHIEQKAEGTYNFAINAGGGTVTINDGWVGGNHGAIAASAAVVVIKGGEFVCTGTAGFTDNVLYTYSTGSITIEGGTFTGDKDTPSGGCCVYDTNGAATINGGSFSNSSGGDVWGTTGTTINGGTFENLTETSYVTVGATITNGGKTYTKTENGLEEVVITEVATYEELVAALEDDNAFVKLTADITATATQSSGYGKAGIVLDAGDILDGNNKTLTINGANGTWDCVIAMKGGEVKNLTISGAMRGVFMPGANGDVVIDNCIFEDVIYTFNSDAGNTDYTVTIKNTTLNGWTSYSAVHGSVTFDGCTFGEGNGNAFCRPYQATTFTDCEFNEGYEMDTKKTTDNTLEFTKCTYNNEPLSAENNAMFYNGGSVVVDGEATDVTTYLAQIGTTKYTTLQTALDAAAASTGNVTVTILEDIDLTNVTWNPVTVSAPGYPVVTVEGYNKTIKGLTDMLFGGTWAGNSGLIIKDLTIANSAIVNDKDDAKGTVGVGAFIGYPQASAIITLNNCHLVNSSVEGGHWTGGLIGIAGGYNGNDGPVFMNLTIKDCSVTGSTITGKGSVGGVIGHGSCAAWTAVNIDNTTVSGNTITSTGSSNLKAGAVMGTIGAAGQATTANGETKTGGATVSAIVAGNTVTSNGTAITTIYGRQGTTTGMLYLDGGSYDKYPIEENVAYAAPAAGYEIVENTDGTYGVNVDPAYGKVAMIGDVYYETFAESLNAVKDGEIITLLDVEGSEISSEIDFTKDITFTITGTAPEYALPVVTFQNATVNIEDATILTPELDARQNATINVINSTVYDAGGNGIVKSYYNGAINIDATSTVYTMQVTTMGYINVTGTLNATWQTNVYGNGLITLNEGATFNTAALHLTAQDYSGRDNTDIERVGKPAEIVVDGANFTVGNVKSSNGADYSYNSNQGINVGTVDGKLAILNIKNGGNVNIYMANSETTNFGAGATVNVNASTLNTICRSVEGEVTLANNGTVYVTGEANLDATVTGDGWFYMNGVTLDADTKLIGAKVGFINGTNNIVGSTIKEGFFSVGIGQNAAAATSAAFAEANSITLGNVTVNVSENAIVSGNGATYSGWVGSAYSADKTQHTYTLNVNSSLATFGYMHVSKDGNMTIMGHSVNKYTIDNANVDFYAGELIVNGIVTLDGTDAWSKFTKMSVDHVDGVLNITNGTNFESSIHNGSNTKTSLKFWNAGKVNIDATSTVEIDNGTELVEGAELNIVSNNVISKGSVTGAGEINLTDLAAKFTAQEGLTVNDGVNNPDYTVAYIDGTYQFAGYVAQIGDNKYLSLQEAIDNVQDNETIVLIRDNNEDVVAGNENLKPFNKTFTIDGANFKVTGKWFFGRDDHNSDNSEITVKNVNFSVNGIKIDDFKSVTISKCTFNNITEGNGIYVAADEFTSSITVENCVIENVAGAGINLRNPVNATIIGNTIKNSGNNAITFQHGTVYTEAETGTYTIIGNVFKNWAYETTEGRAIRIATGTNPRAMVINNNAMIHTSAPEEFVKITGDDLNNVSVDENYWNGANPTTSIEATSLPYLYQGVEVHNYYAAYNAETNELSELVTIEGAGETVEIYYTAEGEVTTQDQAAYSLIFSVTDYANNEASVKIGNKKPAQNGGIELITPTTIELDDVVYNVTSIPYEGFFSARFKVINISEGIKTIESKALANMYDLTDVVFPASLEYIGENCFTGYGSNHTIKTITCHASTPPTAGDKTAIQQYVGDKATLIVTNGNYKEYKTADAWSRFANIYGEVIIEKEGYSLLLRINDEVCSVAINDKPHYNDNLELDIPAGITYFGQERAITSIADEGFKSCAFKGTLVIPANIKTVGNYAFNSCTRFTSLVVEEGVEKLGKNAFKMDSNLQSITLPASLTYIDEECFGIIYSPALTQPHGELTHIINYGTSPATLCNNAFTANVETHTSLYVFEEAIPSYRSATEWNNFVNIKPIEAKIGDTYYHTLAAAVAAAQKDDVITIIADFTMNTEPVVIEKDLTLNLNGKTITAEGIYPVIRIQNGANVTITGEGSITNDDYVFTLGSSDQTSAGNLTIENGIFTGTTTVASVTKGLLTIEGGVFNVNESDYGATYMINCFDANNVNGNGTALVAISGGTFYGFNPQDNAAENPKVNFCATGFGAKEIEDNVWKVLPMQTTQLNAGWNWFSYYVDTDLKTLENALGESGVQIKSKNEGFRSYDETYGWYGKLENITPSQMYQIRTIGNGCSVNLVGELVDNVEITLHKGWNYIGYPLGQSADINSLLANIIPAEGDQIKSKNSGNAAYDVTYKTWYGGLKTLNPGEGYMYYSNSEDDVKFTYNVSRNIELKANITTDGNYWVPNASQYPNNMTMIAMVDVEGGDYEVAAFVDGEVRGSARPIYVEALDAYILFLTIHGEGIEEMTFKYYDLTTDEEFDLKDRMNYSDDAIVGSITEPYMFNRGTTGIGEASLSEINIYPNPTTTGTEINLQATFDKVEVFNALGVKIAEYHNVDSIDAIEIAGIYVIRITNNSNVQNCKLVVK